MLSWPLYLAKYWYQLRFERKPEVVQSVVPPLTVYFDAKIFYSYLYDRGEIPRDIWGVDPRKDSLTADISTRSVRNSIFLYRFFLAPRPAG